MSVYFNVTINRSDTMRKLIAYAIYFTGLAGKIALLYITVKGA